MVWVLKRWHHPVHWMLPNSEGAAREGSNARSRGRGLKFPGKKGVMSRTPIRTAFMRKLKQSMALKKISVFYASCWYDGWLPKWKAGCLDAGPLAYEDRRNLWVTWQAPGILPGSPTQIVGLSPCWVKGSTKSIVLIDHACKNESRIRWSCRVPLKDGITDSLEKERKKDEGKIRTGVTMWAKLQCKRLSSMYAHEKHEDSALPCTLLSLPTVNQLGRIYQLRHLIAGFTLNQPNDSKLYNSLQVTSQ